MRSPGHDVHAWFRDRLDAHALDLLDEDEARRFEEHASVCPACEAVLKAYAENRPSSRPDGHIPARILARWDRAKGRLRGLPRQLIREHLESCAACRQDLEALGYEPVLETVPELETGAAESEDPLPIPDGPHRIVVVQGARRGRWLPWMFGGVAGAAVAAAAMVLVVPGVMTSGRSVPPGVETPAPIPGPPERVDRGGLFALPRAAMLRVPTRSGEASFTEVPLAAGGRYMNLRLPELYLPDTTRLVIELQDSTGTRLLADTSSYGAIQQAGSMILASPRSAFRQGVYRLMVAPDESASASHTPTIVFLLRARKP